MHFLRIFAKAVPLPRQIAPSPAVSRAVWCDARSLLCLWWVIGFCWFFFSFGLPNNPHLIRGLPDDRATVRNDLWPHVPFQLLDIIWPLPEPDAPPSNLSYLPERLPAILAALLIFGAAVGFGRMFLRVLRLNAPWDRWEELYFAGGVGLSLWSLIVLGLGLLGWLTPWPFGVLIIAGNAAHVVLGRGSAAAPVAASSELHRSRWLIAVVLLVCVPMVWAMLLGSLTPQTDFDVLAYHLNGPKEWFQQGRITFLPHNIYTSFPFLTEMLLLSGMAALNDWQYGALAGQAVLMLFAPLTAVGLYCVGRQWFSPSAGWLAALVWLTTPWAYRISIIAYAEGGLAFYLLASVLAAFQACKSESQSRAWSVLAGFLAGSAMACKYPGLVSVIVPVGLMLLIGLARRVSWKETVALLTIYGAGVLLAVGPWLVKNAVETGNPVYPLAYSVFGGRDIDPELNAKWVRGHAAPKYPSAGAMIRDGVVKLTDIVANNDWHSPLLYAFAPLSWLWWRQRRRELTTVWLLVGWLFLTWFLLTHHIDRFWVPMIPLVALLAGAGAAALSSRLGRWIGAGVIIAGVAFNITICAQIGGYNAGLAPLSHAQQIAERTLPPELQWLNQEHLAARSPADFKLLCEGEAATFHVPFPVVYHSVFDPCLLEEWCAAGPGPEFPLKSAEEIRKRFHDAGITHLYVNWRWVLNYREPGNYGFTDFLHPDRLRKLQELDVLGPPLVLPPQIGFSPMSDARRQQLEAWAPSLIVPGGRDSRSVGGQIFPVR